VKSSTTKSWLGRVMAVGLSAALIGGASLLGVAPAHAVGVYAVTGVVNTADGGGFVPLADVAVEIVVPDPGYSDTVYSAVTNGAGEFVIGDLVDGSYTATFSLAGYGDASVDFDIAGADFALASPVTMLADLTPGTVAITGAPVVGNVLTATTAGWPADATLTYEWFYSCGQCGGPIDGETASSYTVTEAVVSYWVGVIVTGAMAGYSDVSVDAILEDQTSAPKKTSAPAPTNLADYLADNGSTPAAQTSTGLPAGALNSGTSQSANVDWFAPDSFVDVYMYSTPILVGTFPVVNGVAQIPLSSQLLGQLAAGNHTLVITGQSSGAVQSVALSVAAMLAATGFDPAVPVTVASLLTLMGGALVMARRRIGVHA